MRDIEGFIGTYGPYLEEIRKRFFRLAIVFVVSFIVGLFSTNAVIGYFIRVFAVPGVTVVATSPFQLLELAMNAGFFTAILVCIPYGFHQTYTFLRDGLLPQERRIIIFLIPLAVLLFVLGFSYGFGVMYVAIQMIAQVNIGFGITNLWDITKFISQILITSALLGVLFEFPIILSILIRFGLFRVNFLRRHRRIAYALIFIFIALLPPTDGLSFIVMALPLVVMYELTILGNSFRKRKALLEI